MTTSLGIETVGGTVVFTRELLLAIGLVQEYGGYDWVTEDFHILFGNGYYDKLEEDGSSLFTTVLFV